MQSNLFAPIKAVHREVSTIRGVTRGPIVYSDPL